MLLASVVHLIASNVAVPFSRKVYASDASNSAGAVVSSQVDEKVSRVLWFGSDKKGHYTMLDNW